ncbi:MAG TPA: VOC family protein [Thermoanaerobaculia bacterium]|nr:VOC family protein [Thermoanaerobaculia bacterium]
MARLEGTRHILAVRDLRTATDFFVDVLGLQRDFGDESDGWSWLSRDNFRVGLGECSDAVPAHELGDHSYVAYVNVDDIDGLYVELVSRGAPIKTAPETKPWGMRELALQTPDGHRLTFGSPAH